MVNLFIDLWDGRKKLEKQTKMSGNDLVEAPWANMIGCTTPHWISENMSSAMVGGGFMSRCVALYTSEKRTPVAYPKFNIPKGLDETRRKLVHDLEYISLNLCGEYEMEPAAVAWGTKWYNEMWTGDKSWTGDEQMSAYMSRKQTHVHKLAIVLAASQRDELRITQTDLETAAAMLTDIEADMPKIFSKIGRTEDSIQAERFIEYIRRKGKVTYTEAYKQVHMFFPDFKDFEGILAGAIRSGQVSLVTEPPTSTAPAYYSLQYVGGGK